METVIASPLQFSPQAVKEIRRLMEEPGFDKNNFLRIGVKGGGCSGLSYILGFDQKLEADQIFESNDLSYIMNPSHSIYLTGMEIHWEDGLNAEASASTIQMHPKHVDAVLPLPFKAIGKLNA